jgi:hypothetical protein
MVKKQELMKKAEILDKKAETQLLSLQEWDLKEIINNRTTQLSREEEIKWFQREKTIKLLKGDNNTKYLDDRKWKRRKTRIFWLEQKDGVVGGGQLSKYVMNYYKGLFDKFERNNFSLDETML